MVSLRDFRTLDKLSDEAASRPIRRRSVEILDYKPADPRPETHLALEGTITILCLAIGQSADGEDPQRSKRRKPAQPKRSRSSYISNTRDASK